MPMPGNNRIGEAGPLSGMLTPVANSSAFTAVTSVKAEFATMVAKGTYVYTCDTDSYIKQGATGITPSAAAGSMYVPAGMPVVIDADQGLFLATIRKAADGIATLQKVAVVS